MSESSLFPSEPLFRHGHREGDYLFHRVVAGALRADGSAVIIDGGRQEVVLLSDDGEFRVLAQRGHGPGEIAQAVSIHVMGDTVLVEDDGNGRFTLMLEDQDPTSYSMNGDFSLIHGLRVRELDSGGRLLMTTSGFVPDFSEPWIPGYMVRHDLQNGTTDTVASYNLAKAPSSSEPVNPFTAEGVISASGGSFVYGVSDVAELVWRGSDGNVHQIMRWQPERTYPEQKDLDLLHERMRIDLARVNPELPQEMLEELVISQQARYALSSEPFPLFNVMQGDGTGGVWISEYVIGNYLQGVRYSVIAPGGSWVGAVETPSNFRLLDVGVDRVLGVLVDDLGVESAAVYELIIAAQGM